MQAYVGHHAPATTALYTPLTLQAHAMAATAINRLREELSG
jgi:hypothetical protein